MAFAFFRFFGQDMAFESVFPFDVSRAGDPESLLGAGIGFHFWHSGCPGPKGSRGLVLPKSLKGL